ncbi:MAG: class I SAM-dependent methyltransferase [Gemmatimonadota bacterium]|nr:class I SAM-dependent methyltransferase [Gemmatimonadota bacterium]
MDALNKYFEYIAHFDNSSGVALDRAHNLFLFGCLVSRKPQHVLELGIGSGFVSWTVVHGLRYNTRGSLTSVDNWLDWKGVEPPIAAELRAAGVEIIAPVAEKDFVRSAQTDAYDFLISDADHRRSGSWIDEHLRITQHDGFMFFHDTNHEERYQGLKAIQSRIAELQLPHFHFTESSRADERCERGWLFAINKKDQETRTRAEVTRKGFLATLLRR